MDNDVIVIYAHICIYTYICFLIAWVYLYIDIPMLSKNICRPISSHHITLSVFPIL